MGPLTHAHEVNRRVLAFLHKSSPAHGLQPIPAMSASEAHGCRGDEEREPVHY
jgi:hypothetical protein